MAIIVNVARVQNDAQHHTVSLVDHGDVIREPETFRTITALKGYIAGLHAASMVGRTEFRLGEYPASLELWRYMRGTK